jgi:two-component system, chemotaxis family, chemotaxis protein CheY
MKVLVAEDDFTSRLLLQRFLSPFGEVHVAVNGAEALEAFRQAKKSGEPYSLVCLDIMMPEMDGQAVLKEIRGLEEADGIDFGQGIKVIMTTALKDRSNVMTAFREQCDAYLSKPIDRARLVGCLKEFGLAP